MDRINPAYLLVAIVALCLVYAGVILTLDLTGHEHLVSGFTGVFLPIIMSLLALKMEVIRRTSMARVDDIRERFDKDWTRMVDSTSNSERRIKDLEEWRRIFPEEGTEGK